MFLKVLLTLEGFIFSKFYYLEGIIFVKVIFS